MSKFLKYGIIIAFAALALWGVISLLFPGDNHGSGANDPDVTASDSGEAFGNGDVIVVTPKPTPSAEPTVSPEPTAAPTPTVTPVSTPTATSTPSPAATPTPTPKPTSSTPKTEFIVVLDAGHGGKDPGAVIGDAYEKDIDLAIVLKLRDILEKEKGITVLLTRDDDTFVGLSERAAFANNNNADLFVSVHANTYGDASVYGINTFYHPWKTSDQTIASAIQSGAVAMTGGKDRGAQSVNYKVLRETTMSSALIEVGFMSCPDELSNLLDSAYQEKMAQGIAQGIIQSLE